MPLSGPSHLRAQREIEPNRRRPTEGSRRSKPKLARSGQGLKRSPDPRHEPVSPTEAQPRASAELHGAVRIARWRILIVDQRSHESDVECSLSGAARQSHVEGHVGWQAKVANLDTGKAQVSSARDRHAD